MLLLPDNPALAARLLARLAALDHQPVQLEELTHDRLPLQSQSAQRSAKIGPSTATRASSHVTSKPRTRLGEAGRTLSTLSSLSPFCTSSCTSRASATSLCARNASIVRRFAYSRKLYDANSRDCRSSERNCRAGVAFVSVRNAMRACRGHVRGEGQEAWGDACVCVRV